VIYFLYFIPFHRLLTFILVVTDIYDTDVLIYSIQGSCVIVGWLFCVTSWGGTKINGLVKARIYCKAPKNSVI